VHQHETIDTTVPLPDGEELPVTLRQICVTIGLMGDDAVDGEAEGCQWLSQNNVSYNFYFRPKNSFASCYKGSQNQKK